MNTNKLLATSVLALALMGTTAQVNAQGETFYAGAGVGQSYIDDGTYDDEDTSFSVFGGYQFNSFFAIEGGYTDFGKIESDSIGAPFEADTVYVAAVGIVPVSKKVSLYGKAGYHSWNLDSSILALTGTTDDSDTDFLYGVGAQYRFTDKLALRGEYTRFEFNDADVDLTQVQLRYDF